MVLPTVFNSKGKKTTPLLKRCDADSKREKEKIAKPASPTSFRQYFA